jgi:hypothetical protein
MVIPPSLIEDFPTSAFAGECMAARVELAFLR